MYSRQYWFHPSVTLSNFTDIAVNVLPNIQIPRGDESEVHESGCKTSEHRNVFSSRNLFMRCLKVLCYLQSEKT